MDRALFAAATGMAAQQTNLDLIANNLANSEVNGFKGSTAIFAALAAPGEAAAGTVSTGEQIVFKQGKLDKSNGAFDVAIDGSGFFILTDDAGRYAYTRNGEFARAADGTLRTSDGWRLDGVRIPQNALSVSVSENGVVHAVTAQGTQRIGTLQLAEFPAPEHLRSSGGTTFSATQQSGRAALIHPGSSDGPKIRYGMLERSNISIIESMMEILSAQRAYEANAKAVTALMQRSGTADKPGYDQAGSLILSRVVGISARTRPFHS